MKKAAKTIALIVTLSFCLSMVTVSADEMVYMDDFYDVEIETITDAEADIPYYEFSEPEEVTKEIIEDISDETEDAEDPEQVYFDEPEDVEEEPAEILPVDDEPYEDIEFEPEEADAAVQEDTSDMPALEITQEIEGAVISVYAPEGAFPEGTYMEVTVVEDEEILGSAADAAGLEDGASVTGVQAFDITFYDMFGDKIEPATEIRVSISSDIIAESDEVTLVHIDEAGETEVVEQTAEETASDEIAFEITG